MAHCSVMEPWPLMTHMYVKLIFKQNFLLICLCRNFISCVSKAYLCRTFDSYVRKAYLCRIFDSNERNAYLCRIFDTYVRKE